MGDFIQFKKNGQPKFPVTVAIANNIPIGTINLFGGNVAPTGWLFCNGQAVSRTDYSHLFAIIGTTFGEGDGSTTFNLPNYNNRFPVGVGDNYDMGDVGGEARVTLTIDEMPSHNHTRKGYSTVTNTTKNVQVVSISGISDAGETDYTGGSQPHNNLPPYLAINYIIKAKDVVTLPSYAHVIDSLDSTSATDALSANMGRNINAKIGDVQYTNGYIPTLEQIDLNDITESCFASVLESGSLNFPVPNDGFFWCFAYNSTHCVQFFTRVNQSQKIVYMRKLQGTTWSAWTSITFN